MNMSDVCEVFQRITPVLRRPENRRNGFLNMLGVAANRSKDQMDVHVSEIKDHSALDVCSISLTTIGTFWRVTSFILFDTIKIDFGDFPAIWYAKCISVK